MIETLYKRINTNVIDEYSKFKFGDVKVTKKLAQKMSKIISKRILTDKKYVLYTTNKFPTKAYYKKNSLLLAEEISKILNLPLVIGEYKYQYKKNSFYDNQVKRKVHLPRVNKKDKLNYRNYIFLMVDDSILTGATLDVSLNELKDVASEVIFFSVINLNNSEYSENDANNSHYNNFGIKSIIKLLNSEGYILTTNMLRVIEELKKSDLALLFGGIDKKIKKTLLKSFKHYFNKSLI